MAIRSQPVSDPDFVVSQEFRRSLPRTSAPWPSRPLSLYAYVRSGATQAYGQHCHSGSRPSSLNLPRKYPLNLPRSRLSACQRVSRLEGHELIGQCVGVFGQSAAELCFEIGDRRAELVIGHESAAPDVLEQQGRIELLGHDTTPRRKQLWRSLDSPDRVSRSSARCHVPPATTPEVRPRFAARSHRESKATTRSAPTAPRHHSLYPSRLFVLRGGPGYLGRARGDVSGGRHFERRGAAGAIQCMRARRRRGWASAFSGPRQRSTPAKTVETTPPGSPAAEAVMIRGEEAARVGPASANAS